MQVIKQDVQWIIILLGFHLFLLSGDAKVYLKPNCTIDPWCVLVDSFPYSTFSYLFFSWHITEHPNKSDLIITKNVILCKRESGVKEFHVWKSG